MLAPAKPRTEWAVIIGADKRRVRLIEAAGGLEVAFDGEDRSVRLTKIDWQPGAPLFRAELEGEAFAAEVAPAAEGYRIRHRAAAAHVLVLTPVSAELHERLPAKKAPDTSRLVLSPMPGLVVAVEVETGQHVSAGQTLFVIEAMKMQNIIRAERDGVLKVVSAKPADSVSADEVLAEFA